MGMCVGEKRKVIGCYNGIFWTLFFVLSMDFVVVCRCRRCCSLACFYLQVVVPPELGYGDTGAPPDIPPNAVLVFELDLIKIDQRAEL